MAVDWEAATLHVRVEPMEPLELLVTRTNLLRSTYEACAPNKTIACGGAVVPHNGGRSKASSSRRSAQQKVPLSEERFKTEAEKQNRWSF